MFVFCSRAMRAATQVKRFVARVFRVELSTTHPLQRYSYAPLRGMFVDHIVYSAYVEFVPLGGLCAIDGAFVSGGVAGDQLAGYSGVCGCGKTAGSGGAGAGSAAG